MGKRTLAETIREISRKHLEEGNGLLIGQCVSAVGWVNGTVPNCKGIVEMPMSESCAAGIAVGSAIVGRRPIFVVRFQDFMALNGSPFINYAAKSKELHGRPTPVFIRALASDGIGPVHSGILHSMFMHFPGFRVCCPMTPGEYEEAWQSFMQNDDPFFVSENRESLKNTDEMRSVILDRADITLFGISSPRMVLAKAADMLAQDGVKCNIVHIMWLKPFEVNEPMIRALKGSNLGLVVDATFEICSAARSVAYDLENASGISVRAMGLLDKTKCLCPPYQNKAPDSAAIVACVKRLLQKNGKKS